MESDDAHIASRAQSGPSQLFFSFPKTTRYWLFTRTIVPTSSLAGKVTRRALTPRGDGCTSAVPATTSANSIAFHPGGRVVIVSTGRVLYSDG